ncbi:MFS general substrate transporter [Suhomyces tanzawaensis NRRL Y-17324]|uniref:MFS general substrate transporter n=1 Tax=Suhomyces tanzawaensis NRRL Y-17324 TaxID=984487 RepID=A0A1E4SNI8_9ASCO|nr:MFS general substrate transporter [Suhomyces tanzawaensis NRRL Y-17324]ODV81091.1 MFS general substrate transporter [Suhomyces tanzawaensis NRRL Y-17324]
MQAISEKSQMGAKEPTRISPSKRTKLELAEDKHHSDDMAHDSGPESNDTGLTPIVSRSEKHQLADQLGDAHLNILPLKKLLVCLTALSLGLFISFCDQTGLTIALPQIAKDLNAETSINWAGTSSLLANCVCQVLFGRLADIFGRKNILLTSLGILAVADLICGFVKTGPQFYVFRAFAGIGAGGTQSLTMVMLSDIVTLKQRGKYQGILGAQVGLGNALGPFIMAGFVEHNSWRNFYHMMPALIVMVMLTIWYLIDDRSNSQKLSSVLSRAEKFKKIDYLGLLFSTASLTLLLVPISGGGSTYAWNSTLVIVMFIIGGGCFVGFVLIEWKIPKLPMIPLDLFGRLSLSIILLSNFFFGMAYYGVLYYLPYYLQIVRQLDAIHSSIFVLPLVLPMSIMSIVAGQIISRTGHYKFVIIAGYTVWTLACGLLMVFNKTTNYGVIVVILLLMGSGIGWTFQPTMVAAQALARKAERAVVISARNVLRSFGGAVGVAIASLIVSNSLLKEIDQQGDDSILSSAFLTYMKTHIYTRIDPSGMSRDQVELIKTMYMKSIKNFFILTIPLMGVCLVSNLFVKDNGLQCIDELPEKQVEKVGDKQV